MYYRGGVYKEWVIRERVYRDIIGDMVPNNGESNGQEHGKRRGSYHSGVRGLGS